MDLTMIFYFFIKELAEEFEWQFTCLGENIENYKIFSASIEKQLIRDYCKS